MRTILDRLFGRKTKEEPQSKHTKVIAPEDLQLLHPILKLKQIDSLEIHHNGRLLLTLSLSDDKEVIFIHYDKLSKRMAEVIDEWKLNTVQQELQQRIGKDIAIIQAILQTLPERLALLSTKEGVEFLRETIMETALQAVEKKLSPSFAPEKHIEDFLARLEEILIPAVQEVVAIALRKSIGRDDLIEEGIYGLKVKNFYPAVVVNQESFGLFIHVLDDQGNKKYFTDEQNNKVPLKGLVYRTELPAGKTLDDFPGHSRITAVEYIGYKIREGEIKLAFAIVELI